MESNKNTIIIDSGYFIALGNTSDQYHFRALQMLDGLSNKAWMTTWPVISEVCHILSTVSPEKGPQFMHTVEQSSLDIFPLTKMDAKRLKLLMHQYIDLPMDLADASLILLAEYLGHGKIVSTDQRDFRTYRWKKHQPFENLFMDC
jgi:predicted nucleic acid-binding protein